MQTGPQISPAMYAEFFKPRHEAMWRRAKELADVRVLLHCCGGVYPLLEDLIDAGLDAINPVQISCRGMDSATLKREFGDRLTFWGGGCDTQSVLPSASPEQVAEHVRQQVEVSALEAVCLSAGAQHHGRHFAAEHRGNVRCSAGRKRRLAIVINNLWRPSTTAGAADS